MNFDFEKNRLRVFEKKGSVSKKIDSDLFSDGKFVFSDLVILMDILKIGESVDLNDYVGIKRFKRQFLKSKEEVDKNEIEPEKFHQRTVKNLFDGIPKYSSDIIVAHLKQIFTLRKCLYCTSIETLLEKINQWNQRHLQIFEALFKSKMKSFNVDHILRSILKCEVDSIRSQKIFEDEEKILYKVIGDTELTTALLLEPLM